MSDHPIVSPIPDDAVEVITETWEDGSKMRATYHVDGKEIGFRYWDEFGALGIEFALKDGIKHGPYRVFGDDGQLLEDAMYIDGKEHGETIQYSYSDGKRLGSYFMDHGTGIDLWRNWDGTLSEEREFRDGKLHGYERWWDHDNKTIWSESHFWNGVEHGIFREWNAKRTLRRGYPRYYVMGKQVNKRQYLRACQTDPTLPPFRVEDNLPNRSLPELFRP